MLIVLVFTPPGSQVYELAVPPVSTSVVPLHMGLAPLMFNVGVLVTVTVAVLVTVQPFPLSPVTVYTVVDVGFTEMLFVVALVLHE